MASPYIANEIVLELDLTGKTATDGVARTKVQIECWLQAYNIAKTGGTESSVDVATLCPQGLYKLNNRAAAGGYQLNLDYIQDWCTKGVGASDPLSLSWLLTLYPNAGAIPFKIIDRAGCTTGIEVTGIISELPDFEIGGQAGQVSSVSGAVFPLHGKPTIAAATAAALATGATAGIPGSWTPLGSITPTLAQAPAGICAAWATGQYVLDSTKSELYWDGSAWQAGRAP